MKKIINIVNVIDPDNLINCGAPIDEYLVQVHKVISLLSRNKNTEKWENEIYFIFFNKNYQPKGSKEKISKLVFCLKEKFPLGINIEI